MMLKKKVQGHITISLPLTAGPETSVFITRAVELRHFLSAETSSLHHTISSNSSHAHLTLIVYNLRALLQSRHFYLILIIIIIISKAVFIIILDYISLRLSNTTWTALRRVCVCVCVDIWKWFEESTHTHTRGHCSWLYLFIRL